MRVARSFVLGCLGFVFAAGTPAAFSFEGFKSDEDFFQQERQRMIEEDLAGRGIQDPQVLEAMRKVPRHRLVPEVVRRHAYEDRPLSIGYEQTISQPYVVAYMTEALRLRGGEKVLEIGTGSGYQAAVLAEIAAEVYTIEIVEPLAERAQKDLRELGYTNIHYRTGDGYRGWPGEAPFDAIIVTAAPPEIPQALIEQLREGGRMVIPVGVSRQALKRVVKSKGEILEEEMLPVRFVPMVEKRQGAG